MNPKELADWYEKHPGLPFSRGTGCSLQWKSEWNPDPVGNKFKTGEPPVYKKKFGKNNHNLIFALPNKGV